MPRTPGGLVLAEQQPPSRRRRLLFAGITAFVVLVMALAGVTGVRALLDHVNPPACWTTSTSARVEVSPEQAGNAAIISAVALRRGLSTRAVTIAIATALQESKLRNLRFGDRDSIGLFQQRPSQGWGTVEQILDPVYASNAFYDKLVKVKDYLTRPLTEVAQDVQRSGAPTAYAQHEDEAQALAAALTGAAPATLVCRLDAPAVPANPADVRAALKAEFGLDAKAPDPGSPSVVTVSADGAMAWAVGSWAVARADQLGLESVTVLDRTWRSDRSAAWVPQPTPHSGVQLSVPVSAQR